MDDATREDYLRLLSITGSRTRGLGELLRELGSPRALLSLDDERLADCPQDSQRAVRQLRSACRRIPARSDSYSRCESRPSGDENSADGASESYFIPIGDTRYPPGLRAIPDPPPWLFCRGDPAVLQRPAVAMVGSRRASHAGLSAAREIARCLAGAGYTICSGLALGIDGAAHRGALQSGRTVAVLASGLDQPSPLRHRKLAEEIAIDGCLITELPFGTAPSKQQFPRRNRIISGLARATIIVEAALPSGSLHTAAAALEQGREVLTLPWSIFHHQGAGCLQLLRDGATVISSLDDLSLFFPPFANDHPKSAVTAPGANLSDGVPVTVDNRLLGLPAGEAGRLLQLIGDGALSVEGLARVSGLAIGSLLVLLGELEVEGWLTRADGLYCRSGCKPCESHDSC
jgi:DNA processing protein